MKEPPKIYKSRSSIGLCPFCNSKNLRARKRKNVRPKRRYAFDHANWAFDSRGIWCNPKAEPNCQTCKGSGVVDVGGDCGDVPGNCPTCWSFNSKFTCWVECMDCGEKGPTGTSRAWARCLWANQFNPSSV